VYYKEVECIILGELLYPAY